MFAWFGQKGVGVGGREGGEVPTSGPALKARVFLWTLKNTPLKCVQASRYPMTSHSDWQGENVSESTAASKTPKLWAQRTT